MYKPAGVPLGGLVRRVLDHDELEAVHLCDGRGMTQEEAGQRMGVSRGTVQRLVSSGREKIILAIIEGEALVVAPAGGPMDARAADGSVKRGAGRCSEKS